MSAMMHNTVNASIEIHSNSMQAIKRCQYIASSSMTAEISRYIRKVSCCMTVISSPLKDVAFQSTAYRSVMTEND